MKNKFKLRNSKVDKEKLEISVENFASFELIISDCGKGWFT